MQRDMMSILRLLRPIQMKRLNENAPDYRLCCVPPTIIDPVPSGGMPLAEGELRPALYAVRDEVTAEEMRSVPAPYDSTAEPKSKALLLRLGIVWIYSSPAFGLTNMLWQAANENLPDGQYWRTSHCRATRRGSRMPLFTEKIKSRRAAGIYSVPRLQSLNRVGSSAMVPVRTCRRCIVL